MNWEVAGRGVEQFEELQLSVFKSRVGHIVNERDLEARGVEGSYRAHAFFLCQAGWNSASIHYDGHVLLLKRMKGDNRESSFACISGVERCFLTDRLRLLASCGSNARG